MKKKNRFVTLLITALVTFAVLLLVYVLSGEKIVQKAVALFLYTLGYGEADLPPVLLIIFAVIGLTAVTIFSSFITVYFLERKSRIKVGSSFQLDSVNKKATVTIKAKNWELFDVKTQLMYYYEGQYYTEEIFLPYLKKSQELPLSFSFEIGSPLYWYLKSLLVNGVKDDDMFILKTDFINGSNNQSYTHIKKFSFDEPMDVDGTPTMLADSPLLCEICSGYRYFDLSAISICNPQYISFAPADCTKFVGVKNGITAIVQFADADFTDFGMLYYRKPVGGNWLAFCDLECDLKFSVVTNGVDLILEIKGDNGEIIYQKDLNCNSLQEITVPISKIDREKLQSVTELCFTARRGIDKQARNGNFQLFDLRIEE